MRLRHALVALLFPALALAGCLGGDVAPAAVAEPESAQADVRPRVVLADIDTGINPYHIEFRDDGPEGRLHPSAYLAGFPADAPALNLTLDAEDYESAVLADCAVWQAVEPNVLYWIPGTRIVGAITTSQIPEGGIPCEEGLLPGLILDRGGHGTMTTSRAAGAAYSLCPECKIVSIQGFSAANMRWASEQPYIDLQTNSWGALPHTYLTTPAEREDALLAAANHPTFVAGGNGLLGFFGVTGHPAYLDNIAGPAGIVMVGGHDGGRFTPWTMTMPHVVADANWHPAAEHDSLDVGTPRTGGGTSGSTPFAAGAFARILLEARTLVNDAGTGVRDGNLVVAAPDAAAPPAGPLDDGMLSVEEAKILFFHTANPRPVRDGDHDGDTCSPAEGAGCVLYPTSPVEWGVIPAALPAYYFVGYGQVGAVTLNATLEALRGDAPIPARPTEDSFYGFDQSAREASDR